MKVKIGLLAVVAFCSTLLLNHHVRAQNSGQSFRDNSGGYVLFSGEVVSPAGTPIEGVHILNTNTNELAISDNSGFFSMSMHERHILRFSAVGFKTYYFSHKQKVNAPVLYKTIVLQTVTVGLKNVDIIAKEEARAERFFKPKPLPAPFTFGYQGVQNEVKPTLLNPISMLYNWLSKEGKQKRQLEELLKQQEIKEVVSQRYESDLIWELTGLTGEELEDFKRHCNLTDYFVTNSNDYEFLIRIKECFNSYQQIDN